MGPKPKNNFKNINLNSLYFSVMLLYNIEYLIGILKVYHNSITLLCGL